MSIDTESRVALVEDIIDGWQAKLKRAREERDLSLASHIVGWLYGAQVMLRLLGHQSLSDRAEDAQ